MFLWHRCRRAAWKPPRLQLIWLPFKMSTRIFFFCPPVDFTHYLAAYFFFPIVGVSFGIIYCGRNFVLSLSLQLFLLAHGLSINVKTPNAEKTTFFFTPSSICRCAFLFTNYSFCIWPLLFDIFFFFMLIICHLFDGLHEIFTRIFVNIHWGPCVLTTRVGNYFEIILAINSKGCIKFTAKWTMEMIQVIWKKWRWKSDFLNNLMGFGMVENKNELGIFSKWKGSNSPDTELNSRILNECHWHIGMTLCFTWKERATERERETSFDIPSNR